MTDTKNFKTKLNDAQYTVLCTRMAVQGKKICSADIQILNLHGSPIEQEKSSTTLIVFAILAVRFGNTARPPTLFYVE